MLVKLLKVELIFNYLNYCEVNFSSYIMRLLLIGFVY